MTKLSRSPRRHGGGGSSASASTSSRPSRCRRTSWTWSSAKGSSARTVGDGVARRLVFVAKEAVYKAIHPLDGTPLDFPDIEIRLAEKAATLRDGRRLRLIPLAGERLVVVALVEAGPGLAPV